MALKVANAGFPVPEDYREQIARWRNRGVTTDQLREAARQALEADLAPEDRWLRFVTICWDMAFDKSLIGRLTNTRIVPNIPDQS